MVRFAPILIDIPAVCLLVFGAYLSRSPRTELVTSFLAVNLGVLCVGVALGASVLDKGLGLSLFGLFHMIRLRSVKVDAREMVYYFAALGLGLIASIAPGKLVVSTLLMASIIAAVALGDRLGFGTPQETITLVLGQIFTTHTALVGHLERLLGGRVCRAAVLRVDFVDTVTLVKVDFMPQAVPLLSDHALDVNAGTARR